MLRPQTAKTNMAANVQFLYPSASNRSETSSNREFLLSEDEDEREFITPSNSYDSHVDFSSISSSTTSTSLASFLQTLWGIYKPPSKEQVMLIENG